MVFLREKNGAGERGRERMRHRKQRGKETEKQRQVDREERLRGGQMTETEAGQGPMDC